MAHRRIVKHIWEKPQRDYQTHRSGKHLQHHSIHHREIFRTNGVMAPQKNRSNLINTKNPATHDRNHQTSITTNARPTTQEKQCRNTTPRTTKQLSVLLHGGAPHGRRFNKAKLIIPNQFQQPTRLLLPSSGKLTHAHSFHK